MFRNKGMSESIALANTTTEVRSGRRLAALSLIVTLLGGCARPGTVPGVAAESADGIYYKVVESPDGLDVITDPGMNEIVGNIPDGTNLGVSCYTANKSLKIPGDALYEIAKGTYIGDYVSANGFNNNGENFDNQLLNCAETTGGD
jgi:hypothetical protein